MITGLITTYNYGRYVVDAVESVLAQTYPDMEIIVVDDGSTDDTSRRLQPYLDRIRYIRQPNAGVDAARNTGILAARGEYVGLLDADDMWHPQRIERQMEFIAEHPGAAVVATDTILDLKDGWPELSPDTPSTTVGIDNLAVQARFAPSGVLIRRDCFEKVGLFRPDISGAEDRDMWIRLAANYQIHLLRLPLMFYRLHGGNLSTTAKHMDNADSRMLDGVFREIPSLRGKWILRRKALSYAASMSSFLYTASGQQRMALLRIIQSLVLWPFGYEKSHHKTPMLRWKTLAVILLRMAGLKRPHGSFAQTPESQSYVFDPDEARYRSDQSRRLSA